MTRKTWLFVLTASGLSLVVVALILRFGYFVQDQAVAFYGLDPLAMAIIVTTLSIVLLVLSVWIIERHDAEATRLAAQTEEAIARRDALVARRVTLQDEANRQRTALRSEIRRAAGRCQINLSRVGYSNSDRAAIEARLASILGVGDVFGVGDAPLDGGASVG